MTSASEVWEKSMYQRVNPQRVLIGDLDAATGNRAHRKLFMGRNAQLAHQHQVEANLQITPVGSRLGSLRIVGRTAVCIKFRPELPTASARTHTGLFTEVLNTWKHAAFLLKTKRPP